MTMTHEAQLQETQSDSERLTVIAALLPYLRANPQELERAAYAEPHHRSVKMLRRSIGEIRRDDDSGDRSALVRHWAELGDPVETWPDELLRVIKRLADMCGNTPIIPPEHLNDDSAFPGLQTAWDEELER